MIGGSLGLVSLICLAYLLTIRAWDYAVMSGIGAGIVWLGVLAGFSSGLGDCGGGCTSDAVTWALLLGGALVNAVAVVAAYRRWLRGRRFR